MFLIGLLTWKNVPSTSAVKGPSINNVRIGVMVMK